MKNRYSRYVHFLEMEGNYFAFNTANGTVMALNQRLYTLLAESTTDVDRIKEFSQSLYDALKDGGMIVSDDCNEAAKLIDIFKQQESDPSYFGIIINPTLDCNLRCWYCYENHAHGSMMDSDTIDAVKRLINQKLQSDSLKHLSVSFFGGEPLLGWQKVVMPLLSYGVDQCRKFGVAFSTGFTTNGVLLTTDKLDDLALLGLGRTNFQISFDGHRPFHDVSRVGINRHPTYDRILGNLVDAAKRGFQVTMRFNYTPDTIDSFVDIYTDLESLLTTEAKLNIKCNFQQVWQTSGSRTDTKAKAQEIANIFTKGGLRTETDVIYHRHVCYADRENSVVVNYNGDVFKCTAREFSPSSREGVLTADGIIEFNELYTRRMNVKYANPACRECNIMPICNAGCSQNKLERKVTDLCPLGKTSNDKIAYLRGALARKIFE